MSEAGALGKAARAKRERSVRDLVYTQGKRTTGHRRRKKGRVESRLHN